MAEPAVTQADRDAAAPMAVLAEMRELIRTGKADHYAEPFASHREAAERATIDRVIVWLMDASQTGLHNRDITIATMLQRGEWKEMGHD